MKPVLQSVLAPGGPDAQLLTQLSWILIIGGALIFILVMALVAVAVRHSRRERRQRPRSAVDPLATRAWLLGAGVLAPGVMLLALLAFSSWRAGQLTTPSSLAPLRITVIAHMWWWEVRYFDAVSGQQAVTANELHIPVDAPVYFALTSADVIHTFWLPSLSGKVDMVPGRVHGLTLRAARPGLYRGQCAEYCGAQHANMALHLTAHDPQSFAAWLTRQSAPAGRAASEGARLEQGRRAFVEARCTACHSVRGLPQPAQGAPQAPDLTHVGSRQAIAAGALPMNTAMLAAWIADPQAIKPGARMPGASISAESVNAIAAWLESLK
jgi:cytochrome c oxidase subunit 2